MTLPYSEKVIEYFKNPKNVGEIADADAVATEGSPACGDMVKLFIKVNPETRIIEDIKFKSYGCASNIATASIITELAKNRSIEDAKQISWKQASDALGGLPPVKVHCAVLAVQALKTAIDNYENIKGIAKERKPTTVKTIRKRLAHVINPLTGLDVLKVDFVKKIDLDKGKVTIQVDLDSDHQFAGNIREEIRERLEPLWDIESVEIYFNDQV
jgi:nitrogen fixation NifU-like protein